MNARLIIGSLLLAATTSLLAQAPAQPSQPQGKREGMRPCAQEPDPAKCESRRKEMRERMKSARDACKGKDGPERGACMSQQMCAKAPDPAACQARAKERKEHRREKHEKGSTGSAPKT